MLKNNLYSVNQILLSDDAATCDAVIDLRQDHEIFSGHFPGNPVLPGVCMVQIIKELVEEVKHIPVVLKTAQNIKFLHPVNPLVDSRLHLTLIFRHTEELITVNALVTNGTINFCSFRGTFQEGSKT